MDWRDRALCREVDLEMFFPAKGESPRSAKQVCSLCEVRAECLELALTSEWDLLGVWGGKTHQQREKLRRARREAA